MKLFTHSGNTEDTGRSLWISLGIVDLIILIGLICNSAGKHSSFEQEQDNFLPDPNAIIDKQEVFVTTEIEEQYYISDEPVTTINETEAFDTGVNPDAFEHQAPVGKSHVLLPINKQ